MSNFTLKLFYNHRVPFAQQQSAKNSPDKEYIYTTRLYACDHVAYIESGDGYSVSGFLSDGSLIVNEAIQPYSSSTPEGRDTIVPSTSPYPTNSPLDWIDREICTKAIVENSQGKTTQIIQVREI